MISRELCVRREYSADAINAVINHPAVRPWVGLPGQSYLDVGPVVANLGNVLLMGEGGGFLLVQLEPGIYEVHTQFVPEARGENVEKSVADAFHYMFTRTDCMEVVTKVPEGNVAANVLAKRSGFELQFERAAAWPTDNGMVGVKYYSRTLAQWVKSAPGLEESGAGFHDKLEAAKISMGATLPIHDDDLAHDRYVGATVEMMASGQIAKALRFYNSWARFSGYGPISVAAENPVVIDIGDALLALRNNDFDVILVR